MKNCLLAGLAVLVGIQSGVAQASSVVYGTHTSDVHRRLSQPQLSQKDVISKYSLVRLWPLDSHHGFQEDAVLGQQMGVMQTSPLINRIYNVVPRTCNRKTFIHFDRGMIVSDESLVVQKILQESKPTSKESGSAKAAKGWDYLQSQFPNYIPKRGDMLAQPEERFQQNLKRPDLRQEINQSTSLVHVKDDESTGQSYVNSIDYTIGGWFKSRNAEPGNDSMPLMTKKMKNVLGEELVEWTLFISGNVIYFHNFRDTHRSSVSKYLSQEEASLFRGQYADFYGADEYYDDVAARPVVGEVQEEETRQVSQQSVSLNRDFSAAPIVPSSKKPITPPQEPVPIPTTPRPPVVIAPPPVLPRPPGLIPVPTPYPVPVAPGNGKEYTLNFDMKRFWWSSSLGRCYECATRTMNGKTEVLHNTHQDAWYYFSVSVHQNDPLGPYVDLMLIQDPNPAIFAGRASMANNVKHIRLELDRTILSRHAHNPFESTKSLERSCGTQGSCVRSLLEIGGVGTSGGYRGYMRGVYVSKKALKKSEMLEMAAQHYPADSAQCTYDVVRK